MEHTARLIDMLTKHAKEKELEETAVSKSVLSDS